MARPVDALPESRPRATEHFPCFDGLRALAAFLVLMHHAAIETAYNLRGELHVPFSDRVVPIGHYFSRMDAGVQIFFVISGFLLYRPFVSAAFDGRAPLGPRAFFRRRFLRIFPAYWFAYICIALFVGLDMPIAGGRSIVEQFFLVHLYDPTDRGARALGGISQSWTLVVEISFYLFLPVFAYVMRRVGGAASRDRRLRIELAGCAVLYAISVLWRCVVYWGLADGAVRNLAQYWLPANLDLFAMGMTLAVLHTWQQRRDGGVPWLDAAGRRDWLWWAAAFTTFTVVTFWVGLPNVLQTVWGAKAFAKQLLYGVTALFLVIPAVFGPQDRGPVRRVLRFAPVVYVGMVSYGIYLWHQAAIKKVHQWGGWARKAGESPLMSFRGDFVVHVLAAFVLSVVLASISYYLVERPALRFKDRPIFGSRNRSGARARA